ncbi:hypothetical protein BDAP_001197 [Binucleata daphniae]
MPHSLISDSLSKTFKNYNKNYDLLKLQTDLIIEKLEHVKNNTNPENISVEESLNFLFLKNQIDRNTRILKTYKYKRCKKIENAVVNKINLQNMCEMDIEYKKDFENLYNEYLTNIGIEFDTELPLNFFVTIVPIKDCGCIMINNELVQLENDKMYYVKRKSIKHLIDDKKVKVINQ